MKRNTRYSILSVAAAFAVMAFAGCSSEEMTPAAGLEDGWLKFRLSGLQLTKGTLINTENEMIDAGVDEFTVQAWNANYGEFVENQTVTYNTTDSEWQTEEPILWAGSDAKTFFAYANLPASDASVTNTCTSTAQKQTLTYTLPLDARAQKDIMLGWYEGNGGTTRTADITLVHPLTSLILKKGEMDVAGIKRITVSGLYASGTADVTYAVVDSEVVPTYVWTTRTGSVISTLEPASGASSISVDGTTQAIGEPFIVIPQNLSDRNITIAVTFSDDNSVEATLTSGEWSAGETNAYTLKYVAGKLTLSVTPWGTQTAVGLDLEEAPEFIDLGLPSGTLWADRNVGAESETAYGDYFAWGETSPRAADWAISKPYNWANAPFNNGAADYDATYFGANLSNWVDGTTLKPEYDAAHVAYGDGVSMPTRLQFNELMDNCTMTWTENYEGTGVNGIICTSNISGYTDKYIFLPAAGRRSESGNGNENVYLRYWSSTLSTETITDISSGDGSRAWGMFTDDSNENVMKMDGFGSRFQGRSVRAVHD